MILYKTEVVPETTKQVCVGRECDICGKASPSDYWPCGKNDIERASCYFVMKCERGRYVIDESETYTYGIDICPDCFESKLVPWVNSQRPGKPPIKPTKPCW